MIHPSEEIQGQDSNRQEKRRAGIALCGIRNAGTIIAFLDSDDYWHPMKLQYAAEEFNKNDHMDFVYHYMNVVDAEYKIIDIYIFQDQFRKKKRSPGSYLDPS
jgi:hypothetical protein